MISYEAILEKVNGAWFCNSMSKTGVNKII